MRLAPDSALLSGFLLNIKIYIFCKWLILYNIRFLLLRSSSGLLRAIALAMTPCSFVIERSEAIRKIKLFVKPFFKT